MDERHSWSLAPTFDVEPTTRVDERDDEVEPEQRYQVVAVLGRGGMGEVRLCRDQLIGRDVAMKVMAGAREPGARLAFVREARLQAQLEHPGIVPVHELAADPDGTPFFTMKRVRGETLAEILERLAARDHEARERWGPTRLLAAFATACLTIDYAHAQGVLHLDLKPQNLMLGSFGEVYVLDWGIARRAEGGAGARGAGTPAYMAPEQVAGGAVDARTDVWALGAILSEILTLERFHADRTAAPAHVSEGLWNICRRATRERPDTRIPTARALHDAVLRRLDRNHEDERRSTQASAYVRSAETMLRDAGESVEGRGRAMAYLGRALALDPHHREALRATLDLVRAPIVTLPGAVQDAVADSARRSQREANRASVGPLLYSLLVGSVVLWMGVRSWWVILVFFGLVAVDAGLEHALARRPGGGRWRAIACWSTVVTSTLAFSTLSRVFGPLFVLPGVMASCIAAASVGPDRAVRRVSAALALLAVAIPLALELTGVLPASYVFDARGLTIVPHVLSFPRVPTLVFLGLIATGVILIPSWLVSRVREALAKTELQVHLQAWHLGRLIPDEARHHLSSKRDG